MRKLVVVSDRDHRRLTRLSRETGKTMYRLVHDALVALYFEKEGQSDGGQSS